MKIIYVDIQNYRNLTGLQIHFNPQNNFIVGENNLGKSNLLLLLNDMFNRKSFRKDDFTDIEIPITINFKLQLDEVEIGVFDDLFDPDDSDKINIKAVQKTLDDPIEFWHVESSTKIPSSMVKCINFLYYDSIRNPASELSFNKSKGVGKFLHYVILKHLENNETDLEYIDEAKTNELTEYINSVICKIKAFSKYSINAEVENDIESLLSRIMILKDGNDRYIRESGYGVQFLAIITLAILQKILETLELKRDRGVFEYREQVGEEFIVKKAMSLVIGFDEPEIHLHPYLQRSLLKYINRILTNEEEDFIDLLNSVFEIDKVIGQSIIATHSPNIILNNYQEIIRFYKDNGTLSVICGSQITIENSLEKHLQMQFPFIKEAFFARCVLVVEGVTEYSALPAFGLKLGFDFDEYGISIIQAGGKGSVLSILALLKKFKIPCLGVVDKDDDSVTTDPSIRQTSKRDFEAEIVSIIENGKENILINIIKDYTSNPVDHNGQIIYYTYQAAQLNKLKNRFDTFINQGIVVPDTLKLSDIGAENLELKKLWHLCFFTKCKDIVLGGLIGESLEFEDIPQVYKNIINDAVSLSNS